MFCFVLSWNVFSVSSFLWRAFDLPVFRIGRKQKETPKNE